MKTILVVEDEAEIRDVLEFVLTTAGYDVCSTPEGETAIEMARTHPIDLAILDIGLPGMSGLEVCPILTQAGIPVLALSSHDRDDQVVTGLEVGAEDYVTKPFNHRELLLRIDKLIRRTSDKPIPSHVMTVGRITVDTMRHVVVIRGVHGEHAREVNLTPTEFELLSFLAATPDVPQSVETLLREVWHVHDWTNGEEMVKVGIRRLRKKIEPDPSNPVFLLNRWGQGYFLTHS